MSQKHKGNDAKPTKAGKLTAQRPKLCIDCGIYPADPPSSRCPGCEAYREHQQ